MNVLIHEDNRQIIGIGVLASKRRWRTQDTPPRYQTEWCVIRYRHVTNAEIGAGEVEHHRRQLLADGTVFQYTLIGEPVCGLTKAQARRRVIKESQQDSGKRTLMGNRLIPESDFQVRHHASPLGEFVRDPEQYRKDLEEVGVGRSASRWVCGRPLPPWQRQGGLWSGHQRERFIESVWSGFDLGSIILVKGDAGGLSPWEEMVIDGQQRLETLESYVNDGFRVYGYLWSELTRFDYRAFMSATTINVGVLDCHDEQRLRHFYDLLNFGGVAHAEADRASSSLI